MIIPLAYVYQAGAFAKLIDRSHAMKNEGFGEAWLEVNFAVGRNLVAAFPASLMITEERWLRRARAASSATLARTAAAPLPGCVCAIRRLFSGILTPVLLPMAINRSPLLVLRYSATSRPDWRLIAARSCAFRPPARSTRTVPPPASAFWIRDAALVSAAAFASARV